MKKDYTILVPDMLPIHFNLLINIFRSYGYKMELLQTSTQNVIDEGLKKAVEFLDKVMIKEEKPVGMRWA